MPSPLPMSMREPMPHDHRRTTLRAALLTGVLSTLFGTLVLWLGSGRLGRDPGTDWMVVASLLLRDAAFGDPPPAVSILTGNLLNQAIELGWALVFFVGLGRWTARWPPWAIALAFWPWAVATSTLEWLVLMPLWPFAQPAFTLAHVAWLGWGVHGVSASLYPLFPFLRDHLRGDLRGHRPSPHRRFAIVWVAVAATGTLVLAALAGTAAVTAREAPHLGSSAAFDREHLRHMGVHHARGLRLARLGAERAGDERLRALARLIGADQRAELRAYERWWVSWFDAPPGFVCTPSELAAMPGWIDEAAWRQLASLQGPAFDAAFVALMTRHHQGAVAMAERALAHTREPRLWLSSHATRHAQRGEIGLLHGVRGAAAVRWAVTAMTAPFGTHPADAPGLVGRAQEQGLPMQPP